MATRVLAFTLLGFLLLSLLGPLQELFGLDLVVLDVPLIIVVYLAMSARGPGFSRVLSRSTLSTERIDWSGGWTALLLGYTTDVLGGGFKGLSALTLALVFLVCRRAGRHVYLSSTLSAVVVISSTSFGASLFGLTVRWAAGIQPTLGSLSVAGFQALLCAAAGPPLLRLLRAVDQWLLRDPTAVR